MNHPTAYMVATFHRIGPFYFCVRLGAYSETNPTILEGPGDHQFHVVLDSASAATFDVALKLLELRQLEKRDLVKMRKHLERYQGTIKKGLETFAASAWAKRWRQAIEEAQGSGKKPIDA